MQYADPWEVEPSREEQYRARVGAALAAHVPRVRKGVKEPKPRKGFGYAPEPEEAPKKKGQADQLKRSIEMMESRGFSAERTEHWNAFSGRKNDLFGCFDYVAIGNGQIVFGQVTSKANKSAREKKIRMTKVFEKLKVAGAIVKLDLWDKPRMVWECLEIEL